MDLADQCRERLLMDSGWRFRLGDTVASGPIHHDETYSSVKAGAAAGPAGASFDDSDWTALDLPHDWLTAQPFDPTENVSHGFKRGGVGWYRRQFDLPAGDLGRRVTLEFDGVFREATIWVNGHRLCHHRSGYTSFAVNITDVANYGARNVVAVRVDATGPEGWWYEGAGIYRHVWLSRTAPVCVARWGVFVAAEPECEIAPTMAQVRIETALENHTDEPARLTLTSVIVSPTGEEVVRDEAPFTLHPGTNQVGQLVEMGAPVLWDLDAPRLYTLRTEVRLGERIIDRVLTHFGIRSIRFDPAEGFFLNGRPVKLKGTCNHQDHAGVGIALPDALQEFRIRRLQGMGSNAYRTAHNPPTPELLDVCDRLGMLVMVENRHLNSSPEGIADLESMVLRDRNHPSVIMWSMANEEPLQDTEVGTRIVTSLIRRTRQLDPTRPTITAMHGGWGGPFSLAHDIQGCNYNHPGYDAYHESHPEHAILGSETSSALTTRGEYVTDPVRGYMSAYDVNRPEWGAHAETAWQAIAERPFMAGTFVWTGFDYRGEPTPYEWPCISSHFGIMDTCGFPKDNFYYYQAWWCDHPVLHLLPHWNWPGREGQPVPVWCHSNCDSVELFLNEASLGRKEMPRNGHLEWHVPYAPGVLSAIGYQGDEELARAEVRTTGPAAALRLSTDRPALRGDGEDACAVTVSVVDAAGLVMPTADNLISFGVSGNARILGVGNGNPSSHEPDAATMRRALNGLCQVIVQTRRGTAGALSLTATSAGLLPWTLELPIVGCEPRPAVPAVADGVSA